MTETVPDILARIVRQKRAELPSIAAQSGDLERLALESLSSRRDFLAALSENTPAIIAEMKKASPSKGVFSSDFQPAAIARAYQDGGAAALSVLTDETFFQGSLDHLAEVRQAASLPILRKDFTIHPVHVLQAAAGGADAILLIAAILSPAEMREFRLFAESLSLAALVEVHDERELDSALQSGARILGVNNRDLRTFQVSIETSLRLAERIPSGVLKVSESGIHSPDHVRALRAAGFSAFLVGERLMTAPDPAQALRELLS